MSTHFNQLTPAEAERLAILAEECAEVIQIVGKILRHGYDSKHPGDMGGPTNRAMLEKELGDLACIQGLMARSVDVCEGETQSQREYKVTKLHRYTHHQSKPSP